MGKRITDRYGPAVAAALLALLPLAGRAALLDQPMPPEQFRACVQNLAGQTALSGRPLRREEFDQFTANARYDDRVRQSLLVQAGEPTLWWDELAGVTDAQRVQDGQRILAANAAVLQKVQDQFGVPKEIVVAIYGIETNFGPAQGRIPLRATRPREGGPRRSDGCERLPWES